MSVLFFSGVAVTVVVQLQIIDNEFAVTVVILYQVWFIYPFAPEFDDGVIPVTWAPIENNAK